MTMEIPGHRRGGRPKIRWKDRLKENTREQNINEHKVGDREEWKKLSRNSAPMQRQEKLQKKKKKKKKKK
eukprot:gene15058-6223_t